MFHPLDSWVGFCEGFLCSLPGMGGVPLDLRRRDAKPEYQLIRNRESLAYVEMTKIMNCLDYYEVARFVDTIDRFNAKFNAEDYFPIRFVPNFKLNPRVVTACIRIFKIMNYGFRYDEKDNLVNVDKN